MSAMGDSESAVVTRSLDLDLVVWDHRLNRSVTVPRHFDLSPASMLSITWQELLNATSFTATAHACNKLQMCSSTAEAGLQVLRITSAPSGGIAEMTIDGSELTASWSDFAARGSLSRW